MIGRILLDDRNIERVSFQFVRHNGRNETILRMMREEQETLARITERSARVGTRLPGVGAGMRARGRAGDGLGEDGLGLAPAGPRAGPA